LPADGWEPDVTPGRERRGRVDPHGRDYSEQTGNHSCDILDGYALKSFACSTRGPLRESQLSDLTIPRQRYGLLRQITSPGKRRDAPHPASTPLLHHSANEATRLCFTTQTPPPICSLQFPLPDQASLGWGGETGAFSPHLVV
jgi:hypothetical protein